MKKSELRQMIREEVTKALESLDRTANDGTGFKDGELSMMAQSDNEYDSEFAKQCKANNSQQRRDYEEGYWDGEYAPNVIKRNKKVTVTESKLLKAIKEAIQDVITNNDTEA